VGGVGVGGWGGDFRVRGVLLGVEGWLSTSLNFLYLLA